MGTPYVLQGIAKANRKREWHRTEVPIVVTGDGAMEEGAFMSLVDVKNLKVPMIIIVENNGWSMYTHHERRFPIDVED